MHAREHTGDRAAVHTQRGRKHPAHQGQAQEESEQLRQRSVALRVRRGEVARRYVLALLAEAQGT